MSATIITPYGGSIEVSDESELSNDTVNTDYAEALRQEIAEFAEALRDKILDDRQVCANIASGIGDTGLVDVITVFLECQSTEDAPHDWIGEALVRRQECAKLISRLGNATRETVRAQQALKVSEQTVADLEKSCRSMRQHNNAQFEQLAKAKDDIAKLSAELGQFKARGRLAAAEGLSPEEARYIDTSVARSGEPAPAAEGGAGAETSSGVKNEFTTPVMGYIVLSEHDPIVQRYKHIDEIDEIILDDIKEGIAELYELGDKLMPVVTLQWRPEP